MFPIHSVASTNPPATPAGNNNFNASHVHHQMNLHPGILMNSSKSHSVFCNMDNISQKDVSLYSANDLRVNWYNLSYVVDGKAKDCEDMVAADIAAARKPSATPSMKETGSTKSVILKGLNGSFKSGELTAIMGPSGCGKTTLLECLAGKRQTGVSGDITFTGCKDVKLSFISQNDQMLSHLTVRESLTFASKLKNFPGSSQRNTQYRRQDSKASSIFSLDIVPNELIKGSSNAHSKNSKKAGNKKVKKNFDHESIVQKLLDQFGLNVCADVRVANCSGGQLKRLSIAQELVSKPNLLILDEPTSGLDSASCFQCIELLQQLTQQRQNDEDEPLAVVATIHQPSARVFNMFKKVIVLSVTGRCIYEGSPANLIAHLSSVGLVCPAFNNPADYVLEVASGDYGIEYLHKLADATTQKSMEKLEDSMTIVSCDKKASLSSTSSSSSVSTTSSSSDIHSLHKRLNNRKHLPFFYHIGLLFHRTLLSILRDPMLTAIRFASHIVVALFIGMLYGKKVGSASGCPPAYDMDNMLNIQKHVYDDIIASSENAANIFFAAMFVMFGAMLPTVLTFPSELSVFIKERSNGWYHSRTYYLAKTMADIPMQILFPIVYGTIIYLMSGQLFEPWRFGMFLTILILTGLCAQSHGLFVSALFVHDPNAAVYVGPMTTIPFLLFAGFFVRIKTMPGFFVVFSYISYVRYAFEAMISLIYGFDRCLITPMHVPKDLTGNSGSNLFKFLTILFSPEYEDTDYSDSDVNATTAASIGSMSSSGSFHPSKGLIESIVKDFQSNNPFFGDIMNENKNETQSYVMKQFDLTESSMYMNMLFLTISFLLFRLAAYVCLMWKANRRR